MPPTITDYYTSPTPSTGKKPKTTGSTPARQTKLTKRKRTRTSNNTFRKSTARTTKVPKVTKRTSSPTPLAKTTLKRPLFISKTHPSETVKNTTPTKIAAVSRHKTTKTFLVKTATKPNVVSKAVRTAKSTVLTPRVSEPVTAPVVYTNSTVITTEQHKVIQTSTESTGLPITIPENRNNFTNSTVLVKTTRNPGYGPGSDKDLKNSSTPTSSEVSSGIPVVMAQKGQAAVMGVAGSLYLWFLHMKGMFDTRERRYFTIS